MNLPLLRLPRLLIKSSNDYVRGQNFPQPSTKPQPTAGITDAETGIVLEWIPGVNADAYEFDFGTFSPPEVGEGMRYDLLLEN